MLNLSRIHAGYGTFQALFDVGLTVKAGEAVAVIGPNGAGKSTLLRAISRLMDVTSGELSLNGVDYTYMEPHRLVSMGIAHVPEGRRLFPRLSVEDNLRMGAYHPKARAVLEDRLAYVYDLFPRMKERRGQMAGTMSGGEQQMLAIARILRTGANLLLLDEITEGLAPVIIQKLSEVVRALKDRGFTIVLVEQNFRFASKLADRNYVIEHGQVVKMVERNQLEASQEELKILLGV